MNDIRIDRYLDILPSNFRDADHVSQSFHFMSMLPFLIRWSLLTCTAFLTGHALAQTLSSIEAAEYEPNSNRWLVSNGSSILVTDDEGVTWSTFGNGGATHGMEVLGTTLFAIQSNVIHAYDVVTGNELGSLSPPGAGFLNGMGSESSTQGDLLVVSDFSLGRLLKVDVSDPSNMTVTTLVSNTGTTPNGVTIKNGIATVVNWYGNADILQVDIATGAVTTLIDGTGLSNCDGVDWANESLVVSSWNPQRITRFSPDPTTEGEWLSETLVQGNSISNPADLSVNSAEDRFAVACSGNNTVYFGNLENTAEIRLVNIPQAGAIMDSEGLVLQSSTPGVWIIRGLDLTGRVLGTSDRSIQSTRRVTWTWDTLGKWAGQATLLEIIFKPTNATYSTWRTTFKRGTMR